MTSVIYFLFGMCLMLNFIFIVAMVIAYKVYSNKKYSVENNLLNQFVNDKDFNKTFNEFLGSGK